jgi:hypothetical protein
MRDGQVNRSTTNVRRSRSRKNKVGSSDDRYGCNLESKMIEKNQATI